MYQRNLQGMSVKILKTFKKNGLVLSGLLLCPAVFAATWDYSDAKGPAHWGSLNSAYHACADGQQQSPIDVLSDSPSGPLAVDPIDYQPAAAGLVKLEHDEVNVVMDQPNTQQTLQWQKHTYRLQAFHFHWPSETQLNGQSFPLEMHFVNQAKNGTLAVLAVFFTIGNSNPAIEQVVQGLTSPTPTSFDIKDLLPANKTFYQFQGSLTTPPCSESVQWFVLQEPIQLSSAQLEAIKKAMPQSNARPIQPLHARSVIKYQQ